MPRSMVDQWSGFKHPKHICQLLNNYLWVFFILHINHPVFVYLSNNCIRLPQISDILCRSCFVTIWLGSYNVLTQKPVGVSNGRHWMMYNICGGFEGMQNKNPGYTLISIAQYAKEEMQNKNPCKNKQIQFIIKAHILIHIWHNNRKSAQTYTQRTHSHIHINTSVLYFQSLIYSHLLTHSYIHTYSRLIKNLTLTNSDTHAHLTL